MGFDLTNVKSVAIPDGNVKSISVGGVEIWKKESAPPADKYSWEAVLASVRAGTYANDYSIGDLIPTDLGAEGLVNMQIVGFDVDDRADGNGKAHISFISKELLNTDHRMNPARKEPPPPYDEGTGSIGGWEKSEMRAYIKNTIKPLIPANVRSAILEVTKTSDAFNTEGISYQQTTQDDVWLPSTRDLAYSDKKETSGPMYSEMFPDIASHKKYKVGSTSASYWWLRSAGFSGYYFSDVMSSSGGQNDNYATASLGVALGFCI